MVAADRVIEEKTEYRVYEVLISGIGLMKK